MREKIMSKNYAIILASGSGSRYGNELPKQFVKIAGKTILEHTIEIFENAPEIDNICVVITPEYRYVAENILLKNNYKKVVSLLNGGETRKDSSFIGISSIVEEDANVIIHDCARPFLSQRIIKDCVEALKNYDAIDVAIPTADTIIEVDEKNTIKNIPVRANLRRGQTPQCFKLSVIKKAHELSKNDKNFTDDCGLIVKYNLCDVYVVEGEIENIKITYPSDIYMADRLFQLKSSIYPQEENLANIEGKTIVVFGGTSGIGKCVCDLASKYNAKVFGCGSSTGCDITSYDNVAEFLKDVYAKQTFNVNEIPEELEYRLENSKEQRIKTYDFFISHSSSDHDEVQILIEYLNKQGKNIYCDWINDNDYLKRNLVGAATLNVITKRLQQSKELIFVVSTNSVNSKWCKYELNDFYQQHKNIYFITIEDIRKGLFNYAKTNDEWFIDSQYKNIELFNHQDII